MHSHPLELFSLYKRLADVVLPTGYEFEFSKYIYIPQEISERREVFKVEPTLFIEKFKQESMILAAREEIAFHSRISTGKNIFHVPMIDMGCKKIEPYLDDLSKAFSDFGAKNFTIFNSGRSFHIYGHALLQGDLELVRFMGRILLLNLPNRDRVIDERWVGHRLMAGYLTLRWTKNNPHYKAMPTGYLEV